MAPLSNFAAPYQSKVHLLHLASTPRLANNKRKYESDETKPNENFIDVDVLLLKTPSET